MTTPDDPLRERYQALLTRDPTNCSPHDGLRLVGDLIDFATQLEQPDGLHHAINIAQNIEPRLATPIQNTELYYFIGNAWSELQRHRPAPETNVWDWNQPEAENAIFAYRTAKNSEGFTTLRPERQARILTNLANLLDHLGRFVDAIELWDKALQQTPGFGMARGNRALGLRNYGAHLYDKGHKALFFKTAHHELTTALTQEPEAHAVPGFTAARDELAALLPPEYLARTTTLHEHPLGTSTEEQDYRKAMLAARLFLNPLNDLGPHTIAAQDILRTPPLVVRIGTGPTAQSAMNQLKQEYVAARYLYDQGTHEHAEPHYADKNVKLTNTLDYPAYGIRREFLRAAFRIAYSLLDKTAYLLNDYLQLGMREDRVTFRNLWYDHGEQQRGLRPDFQRRKSLPLRALYWLAKDLAPNEDVTGTLDPDAQHLALIRNHLEHKFLKLHKEGFHGPARTIATGDLADTLSLHLHEHAFEKKTLRILRLARAAIIYLVLAIHREEQERAARRSPGDKIGQIHLDTLPTTN